MSIKLQRIIAHIAVEVYGFKSFAKLLRLGYVFFKKESFESFKKRSWTRNFDHCGPRLDFFLAEVSKYKASRWSIFSRLSLNKIRPAESCPFIQSWQLFISPEQSNYTSVSTKIFRGIMNSASFDLSITVLDISCLTRLAPRIKLSCKSVNWQYAVISGPAVT